VSTHLQRVLENTQPWFTVESHEPLANLDTETPVGSRHSPFTTQAVGGLHIVTWLSLSFSEISHGPNKRFPHQPCLSVGCCGGGSRSTAVIVHEQAAVGVMHSQRGMRRIVLQTENLQCRIVLTRYAQVVAWQFRQSTNLSFRVIEPNAVIRAVPHDR